MGHFELIDELWKHSGVMWQVMHNGTSYDVSTKPMCTNCFYELGNDMKCEECGKQHPNLSNVGNAAQKASKSYNAAKRRKNYTVLAPQVGEKIADVDLDLSAEQFMNVKLENRKGSEQVVITVGSKNKDSKAQIFVDLAKTEIRHDQTDDNPKEHVNSIKLKNESEKTEKVYNTHADDTELELSEIQKLCLDIYKDLDYKKLLVSSTDQSGPQILPLDKCDPKLLKKLSAHDAQEIEAELEEMVENDYLRKDFNERGSPLYILAKRGFERIKPN